MKQANLVRMRTLSITCIVSILLMMGGGWAYSQQQQTLVSERLHLFSQDYPTILIGAGSGWLSTIRKRSDNGKLEIFSSSDRGISHPISFYTSGDLSSEALRIDGDGTVRAKEIVVTLEGWPDFTFDPNYHLTPLVEVETFIKQNKHLSGIPSEQEIQKNGVHLGEMQAKLLEKVEELTLYLIEQNERLTAIEQENARLHQQLAAAN